MKKNIKRILLIEFLILLIFFAALIIRRSSVNESVDTMYDAWYSEYIEVQNGVWTVEEDPEQIGQTISLVKSPRLFLEKGSYTVTIWYEGEANQKLALYAYTNEEFIKANDVILDKNRNVVSCRFRTTEDIDNLEFKLKYSGLGDFSLSNVTLEKNIDSFKRSFVILAFTFLMFDLCLYYYYASDERRKYILTLLGIVLLTSVPLFYKGTYGEGHDLKFHLMRIEGIVQEIRNGIFPARMSSAWLGGHGYPVSIYYGDLLLYIPAVFRLLGFSITEAYEIFVALVNVAAVLIAEQCFKRIFKKEKRALLLTFIYVTASYRLVTLYIRTAVGEYTALMFLPLIALAVYNIYSKDINHTIKQNIKNATILAVGMTGVITAHVLTAEMVVVALAVLCIICLKKTFTVETIRTYFIAVGETVLLSASFLVPFLDYYLTQSVNITDIVNGDIARTIQDKGANIGDFFAFFNNPFGDWHKMLFNPGMALMAALIVSVILWSMHCATKRMKMLTAIAGLFMFLSTNAFPWDNLAHDFAMIDLLAQVQFPWRFIGIVIIFLTMLLGFILEDVDVEQSLKIQAKKAECILIAATIGMTCLFTSYYADNASREIWYDLENLGTYQVMGGEYLRTDTDTSKFTGEITGEGIISAEIISREGSSIDILCRNGEDSSTVTLPVLNYKGYTITDDTGKAYAITDGENNLISFELPANFDGEIYLRFEEPWYWKAAFAVSLITAVGIVIIYIKTGKKNK